MVPVPEPAGCPGRLAVLPQGLALREHAPARRGRPLPLERVSFRAGMTHAHTCVNTRTCTSIYPHAKTELTTQFLYTISGPRQSPFSSSSFYVFYIPFNLEKSGSHYLNGSYQFLYNNEYTSRNLWNGAGTMV